MKHLFPYILTGLDILACIWYAFNKDYWRAAYWLSAAVLTLSTTRF